MASTPYGWCGTILDVDLSNARITERPTLDLAERFLGGRGVATRIYWEAAGAGVGAFDPANPLIFMTGPLEATGAQGAARFIVAGKSPMRMPEGFCYGNLGGYFGPYLKRAGYDGIVVSGRSEGPVYLWIDDGRAELRDAAALWGKGVYATADALKADHGKNVRFVTTGPAGENLVRTANIMTDNEGSATGGFGAVMGSKNLKAIAVHGTGAPQVAFPDRLKELSRLAVHLSRRDPLFVPFPPDQFQRTGKASCFQCGLDCIMRNAYRTASGKTVIRKCQAMFVYFPWVMGRPGEPAETAVDATAVCNDLSLCTMEMANVVAWLQACHKAGVLAEKDTGLDMSQLGTRPFFETLAGMIARREGFGDVLAEGLLRAGETLGEKARSLFSSEVSGVGGGAMYSAREYPMNGLLYALEPRQPIAMLHEASRLVGYWVMHQNDPASSPVSSDVFRAVAARFWGHDRAWDMTSNQGKARAAVAIMDRTFVKDSLMLCDSGWPLMFSWNTPDHVGDPTLESRIFSAVTGVEIDEAGLNLYGERIFNLQRAVLLREGRRPVADDTLREFNFKEPVKAVFMNPAVIVPGPGDAVVRRQGETFDLQAFEAMRREFYELRGWDPDTGRQTEARLQRLGLDDLAADLRRMGMIAA